MNTCNYISTTSVTSGAGTAYPSGAPVFTVVGGDKDGELLHMAPWSPLFCLKTKFQHHRRNGFDI